MTGLFAVATLLMGVAHADDLSVTPAWLEVDAADGATVVADLHIRLDGQGVHQVRVYTGDWSWEDGTSRFSPEGTVAGSAELSIREETAWVDAGQPAVIPVHIQTPIDGSGSQYGVIFVEEVVPDDARTGGIRTTSRIAVPVLVSGGEADVQVESVVAVHSGEDAPLDVRLALANDGTEHVRTRFQGAVRSETGSVVTFEGSDRRVLMPGQQRELVVAGPMGLEPGQYELLGVLHAGDAAPISIHEWFVVDGNTDGITQAEL